MFMMLGCTPSPRSMTDPLRHASDYELYSLNPTPGAPSAENFHGWKVLGRTPISDPMIRKKLTDALFASMSESDGFAVGCFSPRHAIRVIQAGRITDYVICFQCIQVEVFDGANLKATFLVSKEPRALFDEVLRGGGIPLAAGAE
jgi:hypothetical protein